MEFLYTKAFHIIFVVTWFSGMFYLCRLLVYQREAADSPEPARSILLNQYKIMVARLLFGITWPSALITMILGFRLLWLYPTIPGWLWIKTSLALLLFAYHCTLHRIGMQHKQLIFKYSGNALRIWNEVATLFLVAIVMLVIVRQELSMLWGLLMITGLAFTLMLAIRIYRHMREK